jgi:hypothetical protein
MMTGARTISGVVRRPAGVASLDYIRCLARAANVLLLLLPFAAAAAAALLRSQSSVSSADAELACRALSLAEQTANGACSSHRALGAARVASSPGLRASRACYAGAEKSVWFYAVALA